MRNHIYLHTSNFDYAQKFRDDDSFEPAYNYSNRIPNMSPYEWGRIKTGANYYHILVGAIRKENCPWCGSQPNFIELTERVDVPFNTQIIKFCMECLNCGSRGPVHRIQINDLHSNELKEIVKDRIKSHYSLRKQWDDGLVNPYEKQD